MGLTVGAYKGTIIGSRRQLWSSYWKTHLFGEDDLAFRVTTRSGLTLTDEFGHDASILLPCIKSLTDKYDSGNSSGIVPDANTIWIFRAKFNTLSTGTNMGSVGTGAKLLFMSVNTGRYGFGWGDKEKYSPFNAADLNWHIWIIYNKSLWVLPPETSLTDANILTIIGTTPTLTDATATFGTASLPIRYFNNQVGGNEMPISIALSYIGNINDNVITWNVKHIFKDTQKIWDALSNTPQSFGGTGFSVEYSPFGASNLLDDGHSVYYKEGSGILTIPYVNGSPFAGTPPAGYVKYKDCPGNANYHNLAASLIRFPIGSKWDRSDTTIFTAAARAGFYDAVNPTDWHITELNQLAMHETFYNAGQDIAFVHAEANSVDDEDRAYLKGLFAYSNPVTGEDLNKVLLYTNDYDYFL